MKNFKNDSAGGKAVGQKCEGKGSGNGTEAGSGDMRGSASGGWNVGRNRGGDRRANAGGRRRTAVKSTVVPGRYVDLTLDAGFKAVFADRSNKAQLIGLLNVLLPPEARVKDIVEYLDRETGPDFLDGKSTRMDLVCRGEDSRTFIVEMQRRPENAFFERCVYYGAGVYHMGLLSRETYKDDLKAVYIVGILNYSLPHEDEALWDSDNIVSCYRFIESRTGELAPDTILCIFAELERFTKSAAECVDDRDALFWLFRHSGVMEELPEELSHSSLAEGVTDACEIAGFSADKRILYEKDMITELDLALRYDYALDKGRAEGEAKGKAEGLAEGEAIGEAREKSAIARRMLEAGLPLDVIVECSGLSEDEVRELAQSTKS